MRILLLLAATLALFNTLQAKKCCNHECSQVISQGRSFREYYPPEKDGLPLERDVKVWVFMKEMGVNEDGDEMWYGESRGNKGYFPKQLIGEYMVLCRDLVEVMDWQPVSENNRNEPPIESEVIPEQDEREKTADPMDTPEFHAPDTEAMKQLKIQMDQDFLNRILEGEGVESIDEIEAERYTEILSDPVAARVIFEALEAAREPEVPPQSQQVLQVSEQVDAIPEQINVDDTMDTSVDAEYGFTQGYFSDYSDGEDREISQPDEPDEVIPEDNEDIDREISQPVEPQDLPDQGIPEDHQEIDREISQPEEPYEIIPEDNVDIDREISQPVEPQDLPDQGVPEDNQETEREISQPDEPQVIPEEVIPEDYEDSDRETSHPDDPDEVDPAVIEPVIEDTDRETSHPDEVDSVEQLTGDSVESPDQNTESADYSEQSSQQTDTPDEHTEVQTDSKLFGFIPSPLSEIFREYIRTYGIFYITVYTVIPLLITHLYWSRSNARREVGTQKMLASKQIRALEQKIVALQKEKKLLEAKLEKDMNLREENTTSKEELMSLSNALEGSKQELETKAGYIMQLETDSTHCNAELISTQNALNEKCVQIDRLETLNASAQEEILSLNGKIESVGEQLKQADTEKMTLQLRLDANIDSFAELKEKLAEVEKSRDDVEHKRNLLQDDLKQREVRISASLERIHTLEGEIEVLTNSLLKLQPEAVGKSKVSETEVRTMFETLTNTAKALSELEQVTVSKDKFELQNKLLSTENVSLKAKCEDLEDNMSCVKSSNILLKKQLGDSDTKLQVLNEYFNTKESELHRQLNESRNNQLLLEGKDHRSHDEIDSVRSEREGLKTEILELKQQHSHREKSLLEQIASLEKRIQENLYNSRRSEQEIRWRDREITELKRKLGESSLPSSQVESYLSPRSTSPSSQFSSNSDTETKGEINRTSQSPIQAVTLPTFTSGPPARVDMAPAVSTAQIKPPPLPGFHPSYMPPNFYPPAPFPPMMPPFGPRQVMPQNMAHYNSPSLQMKQKPAVKSAVTSQEVTDTHTATHQAMIPAPEYYAPSPPTLIDTPPNQDYVPPPDSTDRYSGSLLDSHNAGSSNTPTNKDASAFLIDV